MTTSLYRSSPRDAKSFVIDCIQAGLVPFLQSSPGMGKSSIMAEIANEFNLVMIDHRLSTSAPEDLSGLPQLADGKANFVPFSDLFPIAGTPQPAGKEGWMLFLDEFNSASKAVQAAAYKLILDKMVGQHKLHERVVIVTAGNLASDKAITNPISTAMQSRVVHIEMEINHSEWLYDVALKQNYDARIIAFLAQFPSKLMDFRPEHNEKTFCCPRTWEFMNKLIKDKPVDDSKTALYGGTITSGVAVEFVQFTKVFGNMISVAEILADPHGCRMPVDTATRWATIAHLMEKIEDKNFDKLAIYAGRFTMDFQVLFFRSVMVRHPHLRQHPAFAKAMQSLASYLRG